MYPLIILYLIDELGFSCNSETSDSGLYYLDFEGIAGYLLIEINRHICVTSVHSDDYVEKKFPLNFDHQELKEWVLENTYFDRGCITLKEYLLEKGRL